MSIIFITMTLVQKMCSILIEYYLYHIEYDTYQIYLYEYYLIEMQNKNKNVCTNVANNNIRLFSKM
jgi:hypothetical protein